MEDIAERFDQLYQEAALAAFYKHGVHRTPSKKASKLRTALRLPLRVSRSQALASPVP